MKHLSSIAIVALSFLAGNAITAQTVQTNAAAETSPDPAIIDKLREIVTIRQNLAEANQRAVQNGKGTTDGSYELALAKARLKLAREQGLRNEQVGALKDALNVQQRRLEEAKRKMQVGAANHRPGVSFCGLARVTRQTAKLIKGRPLLQTFRP